MRNVRTTEEHTRAKRVLAHALNLVSDGWTRNAPARDAWLKPVPVMDEAACVFCAQGAIYRAAREMYPDAWAGPLNIALKTYSREIGVPSIPYWQDTEERTIGQVKEMFRRSIIALTPMKERV